MLLYYFVAVPCTPSEIEEWWTVGEEHLLDADCQARYTAIRLRVYSSVVRAAGLVK